MQLTSRKNPAIQALQKAIKAGRPTGDGLVAIEGPHLLEEAFRSGWPVIRVFVNSEMVPKPELAGADVELIELPPGVFSSISGTETSQGVIALVRPKKYEWQDVLGRQPLVLVLDGIQDPGNAGTLLRSAEAFGATGVVLLTGTVRVSNGKFLRASAGSVFRIPFLENIGRLDFVERLRSASIPLFALAAKGRAELGKIDFRRPLAICVGSEGFGVSAEILAVSETLRVPMIGAESLNAAVAGSIALFEAARQRFGS